MQDLDSLQLIMRSHWTDSACCEEASVHIQMAVGTGEQEYPVLPLHPTPPHAPRNVTTSEEESTCDVGARFSCDCTHSSQGFSDIPRSCCSPEVGRGLCCAGPAPGTRITSPSPSPLHPHPYSQEVTAAFSKDWLGLGRKEEPQGDARHPPLWVRRGRAGADPSLSLLTKGGGWRGRQPVWCSQSWCWQYFKMWYILSQPGICTYFLSSACYDKSVKI